MADDMKKVSMTYWFRAPEATLSLDRVRSKDVAEEQAVQNYIIIFSFSFK